MKTIRERQRLPKFSGGEAALSAPASPADASLSSAVLFRKTIADLRRQRRMDRISVQSYLL